MGRPRLAFDRRLFFDAVVAAEEEAVFPNIGLLVDDILKRYNALPVPQQILGAHNIRNRLMAFSEAGDDGECLLSDGAGRSYRLATTKGRQGRKATRTLEARENAPEKAQKAPRAATPEEAREIEQRHKASEARQHEEEREEAHRDKRLTSFERCFMRIILAGKLIADGHRAENIIAATRGELPEVEAALAHCEASTFRG